MRKYSLAFNITQKIVSFIYNESGDIILRTNIHKTHPYADLERFKRKVNEYIKPTMTCVNQTIEWDYHNEDVYTILKESLFKPSNKFCKYLKVIGFTNICMHIQYMYIYIHTHIHIYTLRNTYVTYLFFVDSLYNM